MAGASVEAFCIKRASILRLTVPVLGGVEQFFILKRECVSQKLRILVACLNKSAFVKEIALRSLSLIA